MTGSRGSAGGGDTGARDPARGTPEERLHALGADEPWSQDTDGGDGGEAADGADGADHVVARLAHLPAPPLPAHVLADIDRALAAERAARSPRPAPPRRSLHGSTGRRAHRVLVPAGAAVAATAALALLLAVALGVVLRPVVGPPAPHATPGAPAGAAGPAATGPGPVLAEGGAPTLGRADVPRALRAGLGAADAGPLTDPRRLAACLAAQPAATAPPVVGARRVVLDGAPGVLLVLPTGVAARFRLLVVGEDCAAGRPATLADTVVGR